MRRLFQEIGGRAGRLKLQLTLIFLKKFAAFWGSISANNRFFFNALRSADYRSILAKIAKMGPVTMNFIKNDVAQGLTDIEKKKFNNFLQKMKKLNVIRSSDLQGEYIFNIRMVRFYIWLQASKLESVKPGIETA